MSNKKLEVVELNKEKDKIVLEEEQSRGILFWKKYGKLLFLILFILSLAILITSVVVTISNLSNSGHPFIKEVSIDAEFKDLNVTIDPLFALTDETAKNSFTNSGVFKSNGEVLLVKTVKKGKYTIKFYSDYTAIMILKNSNEVIRINSIDGKSYGIKENGDININAETTNVKITSTKEYIWGTVNYLSDGSAYITDSKIDMFVRNSKDINESYISNNKVSYLKETKTIGRYTLNYYCDGTIQVIDGNRKYIIRSEKDIKIENSKVIFPNNNEAVVYKTENLKNGIKVEYYSDGGAIIYDGSRTLSVRKSNSIIISDNKIYEIVDNIYVTISKTLNDGNIIYYTNGSAIIKNYNGKTIYVEENSNIKLNNGKIKVEDNNYEFLTDKREIGNDRVNKFESVAVVETDSYIAIVSKDNILYNSDGSIKELLGNIIETDGNPIKITNSTNETIKYRLVLENSNRTTMDVQFIKYQLLVGETYIEPKRLDSQIWKTDAISNSLSVTGINYILVDKTLEAHATDEIKLMLWTDYESIPNSMQDKYFYGTLRIYAWQELEKDNL